MRKTGLCFFPAFDWAISKTHPEREERLLYTYDQLKEEGVFNLDNIIEYKPIKVRQEEILRTHITVPDIESNITDSHLIAVGGVIALGDALMNKEIKNAFALIRPPGHHSFKVVYGNRGFCNINNEAILVDYLRAEYKVKKIAIVDTDCHHGDGTQDIFWYDPDVLCISMHQDGRTLYPGTGFINECGDGAGTGYTLNFPLPPSTGEDGFLLTIKEGIMPIIEEFKPEIIINSAGQDNHYTDPITNMRFSAYGYAKLTEILNPDIAVLEGGYSIEGALPYVNLAILLALAGIDYSKVKEPDYSREKVADKKEYLDYIKDIISKIHTVWKNRGRIDKNKIKDGFIGRTKRVFYDTEYITDMQYEAVKVCDNCSGFVTVDSKCHDKGYHIFAITIPFDVCSNCEKESYEIFNKKSKEFHIVYMQDKKNNRFDKKIFL